MRRDVRKKAAALSYDPTRDAAPRVTAQGKGKLAERIIESAKENRVPIQENAQLADALTRAEIGGYVSEDLYNVVAEVLAFVWRLEKKVK